MTSSEHERSLDQTLDNLLNGDPDRLPPDIDPALQNLLPIAHDVQSALANTPPPPHGLRPGRSAFLTAAATQDAGGSRFSLPTIMRTLGWVGPTAAILIFAIMLTGLYKNSQLSSSPPVFTQPQTQPAQTISSTPALLPAPALESSPTSAPIKNKPEPTSQEPLPLVDGDIPSARTERGSPTAPTGSGANLPAEATQQPTAINNTSTVAPKATLPEPTPTSTVESVPTASVSTSEPKYAPTAMPTTTPTLTPTVAPVVTKTPSPVPTQEITPPAPVTAEPVPITVTPPVRPSSTPGPRQTPSTTPNAPTKTPQGKIPTATPPPSS